jgi:UDP-N-acetylglucosamine diphosphorylase/glucosamine-1-phosphate N-acetyltransferase
MTGYILCDTATRDCLLPFTYTRPVADCRTGILTIREKWEFWLKQAVSTLTADYLSERYPLETTEDNFFINSSLIPDTRIVEALHTLKSGEQLVAGNDWLMTRCNSPEAFYENNKMRSKEYHHSCMLIRYPWEISQQNAKLLRDDFEMLTRGRASGEIDRTNTVLSSGNVFIEEGAQVLCATLNASSGPIYIGRNAQVMEGSLIRGPFALCEGATVKMGTKIYGATTVGPDSVVAGEITNSVFFGYSNKGHDGFVGNAVIGEWCNLGAATNCSNLKNNMNPVKIWNESMQSFMIAGPRCGMLMGDFSRSGINTMFNTGSQIGVSCNVFGADFPPVYLSSFLWGGNKDLAEYDLDKALRDAGLWKQLKGSQLTLQEQKILKYIFNQTIPYRKHLLNS